MVCGYAKRQCLKAKRAKFLKFYLIIVHKRNINAFKRVNQTINLNLFFFNAQNYIDFIFIETYHIYIYIYKSRVPT
jgi:hypothetical protein